MPRKHRFESEGLAHLFERYVGKNKAKLAAYEQEVAAVDVAKKLYELRTNAGLTQAALAKAVGTTASVISRLEDADYNGHSLSMLRRVASTLEKRVEIRFVDARPKRRNATTRSKRRKMTRTA